MAIRQIIEIDEEKCDGCGLCVPSCAEGALKVVDGKARLMGDVLCDGLGACLGECPQDALHVIIREAVEFDEAVAMGHVSTTATRPGSTVVPMPVAAVPMSFVPSGGGCPGSRVASFNPRPAPAVSASASATGPRRATALRQWPIQLHLVPPTAPFFERAHVLLAADCAAFAVGDFHGAFLDGRALAIACPKLDQRQETYLPKLRAMIDEAKIETLTVVVMEVPCCSGLLRLAQEAVASASRRIPIKYVQIGVQGDVLREEWL
jgi:NAD-dependent dihydropyrimidine dehydrogenase PreA subunit